MSISALLRRTFLGRPIPATEDIQRRLLTYLQGRGFATMSEIADAMMSDLPEDVRARELTQAAQILVNQKRIEARAVDGPEAGRTIDPVRAAGPFRLSLLPRAESPAP